MSHSPRRTIVLNNDWQFRLGGEDINPNQWRQVNLPHSFSMPYFMSDYFYTGEGWYKKEVKVPKDWLGKTISLDFEGAFQVTEVFVNGRKTGSHEGGYTPFRIDLTPYLREGENTISVRVDNNWNPRIAPRAGEHCFSGGIYRDVYLVVNNPVHIPFQGVWIRTSDIGRDQGTVSINTDVVNEGKTQARVAVRHMIHDSFKKETYFLHSETMAIEPDGMVTVKASRSIPSPDMWSPENPRLYQVKTQVVLLEEGKGEGAVSDEVHESFGFRTLEWTSDQGFFLNGKHVMIRGANVHQDHAGWGDAVTNAGHVRDVRLMKEAGFNFIRGSHYPHDPAFVQACDELGVMFLSEAVFWGMGGQKEHNQYWNCDSYPRNPDDRPAFEESCVRQLREMIKAYRNNPSIILWSIGNEAFFTHDQKEAKEFGGRLIEIAKEMDPDRLVAMGGGQRGGFDKLGDVSCYNGDGAHVKEPGMPNMVSEYGSVSCRRPGAFNPGWGDTKGETYEWRAGQVIWCGFDHGSIWSFGGRMGIVDYFRIPKRAWYWYRQNFRNIEPPKWPEKGTPAGLSLTADKKVISSCNGQDDVHITVCITDKNGKHIDAEVPVTLTIKGPGEFPTGKSITFSPGSDIDLIEGCAAIEMRSYHAGEAVITASSPGLKDARLKILVQGNVPYNPSISPEEAERPYKRYTRQDWEESQKNRGEAVKDEIANLATNRPCRASSNNDDRALASDGNFSTAWKPSADDKAPEWVLDMEFEFNVGKVSLDFSDESMRTVSVFTSVDGKEWNLFGKKQQTKRKTVVIQTNSPLKTHYVKIAFDETNNASISEISVTE